MHERWHPDPAPASPLPYLGNNGPSVQTQNTFASVEVRKTGEFKHEEGEYTSFAAHGRACVRAYAYVSDGEREGRAPQTHVQISLSLTSVMEIQTLADTWRRSSLRPGLTFTRNSFNCDFIINNF